MGANALLAYRDSGVQMGLPAVLLDAHIETEVTTDVARAIPAPEGTKGRGGHRGLRPGP